MIEILSLVANFFVLVVMLASWLRYRWTAEQARALQHPKLLAICRETGLTPDQVQASLRRLMDSGQIVKFRGDYYIVSAAQKLN